MKISVVIPLHNNAATIAETLASVAEQTCPPAETVVVDDGSTDGGADAVRAFADRLPSLRFIQQSRSGAAVARNRGVEAAANDWIAFVDADDVWFPQHLEALAHAHTAMPKARLVGTGFIETKDVGAMRQSHASARRVDISRIATHASDHFRALAEGRSELCTSTVMVEKAAFLDCGGFPPGEPRGEDLALWALLARRYPVAMSAYTGGIYRRGIAASATSKLLDREDAAIKTYLALAADTELYADRRFFLREAAFRLALTHALEAVRAGRPDIANRIFLPIAAPTRLHSRRLAVVRLAAALPATISTRLIASWLALRQS